MARPLRIQFPGALYHVTNRGNERKPIFKDDTDRRKFLEILSESNSIYSTRLYCYVLMLNHWHFLLETPLGNLSEFMRHFNITYTSAFNRRHHRVGHLFQGRYKSVLVDKSEYLTMVSRYIHLNPVKVKRVVKLPIKQQLDYLWGYPWSSLAGTVSPNNRLEFVEYQVVLEEYGGDTENGRCRYKEQIVADLTDGLPYKDKIIGQCLLGGYKFVNKIKSTYLKDKDYDRERPAVGEVRKYLSRDTVLDEICRTAGTDRNEILFRPGPLRQMAMDLLYRMAGLNNPEIGRLMNIDYSTVSQGRKRFRQRVSKDQSMLELWERIEAVLSRIKI